MRIKLAFIVFAVLLASCAFHEEEFQSSTSVRSKPMCHLPNSKHRTDIYWTTAGRQIDKSSVVNAVRGLESFIKSTSCLVLGTVHELPNLQTYFEAIGNSKPIPERALVIEFKELQLKSKDLELSFDTLLFEITPMDTLERLGEGKTTFTLYGYSTFKGTRSFKDASKRALELIVNVSEETPN